MAPAERCRTAANGADLAADQKAGGLSARDKQWHNTIGYMNRASTQQVQA